VAEPSASVMHLARLRAAGALDGPVPSFARAAAAKAGRTIVDTGRPGKPSHSLGWTAGFEPAAGEDTGVVRRRPGIWLLLTFAACLSACWIDLDEHPFPGRDASENEILVALATIGSLSGPSLDGGLAVERHQKGALRKLRDAGLLDPDEIAVRLGPQVAVWSDGQIDVLRTVWNRMPTAPKAAP
jgi:hypothetical protein